MGDRLRQVAGGITTTYTLDLNAGLTQVLADGTNTYLHGVGNGRIAQYAGATPAYFLGDALGSVRQLTNASGAVTLARSYQPYGSVMSSTGTGTTNYDFTGEWRDNTGLLHLRARYLSTQVGRFITRDIWPGDQQRPMSFNAWLYAYADPVNLTDPTGRFTRQQIAHSFNAPSFELLLQALDMTKEFRKWGFLAALLAAEDGDQLFLANPVISALTPYMDGISPAQRLWLNHCDEIMIGARTLADYFTDVVLAPNPRESALIWRDTSPSYYTLFGVDAPRDVYVDGSDTSDLPDFHSVDFNVPFTPSPCGLGLSASVVADRFGNVYGIIGPGGGCGAGVQYSEGYIVPNVFTADYENRPLPDMEGIKGTIKGLCITVGVSLLYGVGVTGCASFGGALIFSFGASASVGGSVTYGIEALGNPRPNLGWNWAIEDRLNGVTLAQLWSMPETP